MNVRLPRFRVSGEANLSAAVRDGLGVKDLFDPRKADLRLMTDKEHVVLTDIKHK